MRQRGRGVAVRALVCSFLLLASAPLQTEASDSGTVEATVTGAAPCITVSGVLTFGTLAFSTGGTLLPGGFHLSDGLSVGTPPSFTNCGAQSETVLAHGSSFTNGSATWTLGDSVYTCGTGDTRNQVHVAIRDHPYTSWITYLSAADSTFMLNVDAGAEQAFDGYIQMPCTGSDGAGLEMSSTITLTVTF